MEAKKCFKCKVELPTGRELSGVNQYKFIRNVNQLRKV